MCIAIYDPSNKPMSEETWNRCFTSNPDGCGIAYKHPEKGIQIIKSMTNDLYNTYKEIATNHPVLVHFRIATHGSKNLCNCHPFYTSNGDAIIHNGIITGYGDEKRDRSDTRDFIKTIIDQLPKKWYNNTAICSLIEGGIGYSKMVVMTKEGKVKILNESSGSWDDGKWWSNNSYKAYTYTNYTYQPYLCDELEELEQYNKTFNRVSRKEAFKDMDVYKKYGVVTTKVRDYLSDKNNIDELVDDFIDCYYVNPETKRCERLHTLLSIFLENSDRESGTLPNGTKMDSKELTKLMENIEYL